MRTCVLRCSWSHSTCAAAFLGVQAFLHDNLAVAQSSWPDTLRAPNYLLSSNSNRHAMRYASLSQQNVMYKAYE